MWLSLGEVTTVAVEKEDVKEVIMTEELRKYYSDFRSWGLDAFRNTSWIDDPTFDWFCTRIREALDETRNSKPFVIGVCGNAGTGKNAAVEFFTKVAPYNFGRMRCSEMAFADPIREIGKIFGFTAEQMSDRTLKETVDEFWGVSPRTFMQKVGTEMFRENLCQDVWVKLALRRIAELSQPFIESKDMSPHNEEQVTRRILFVTDVRFPNEAEAIKSIGGHIVKIRRKGFDKKGEDLHPSERFINDMPCDIEIANDCNSLQEWQWKFAKWLTQHLNQGAFQELHKKWVPRDKSTFSIGCPEFERHLS